MSDSDKFNPDYDVRPDVDLDAEDAFWDYCDRAADEIKLRENENFSAK